MPPVAELEKYAMELPERQRAILAAHILHSLPAPLKDEDEGLAEALLRDAEMDQDSSLGLSIESFGQKIQARRCR